MSVKQVLLLAISILCLLFVQQLNGQNNTKTDKYGHRYYLTKKEPHFSKFRWISKARVPMYQENSEFSNTVIMLDAKDFVEIVDGNLGLELTQIRLYDKVSGYIEGWTKNQFMFNKDYFGEPLELSEQEIARRKEATLQRKQDLEERKKKQLKKVMTEKLNSVVASARADSKNVIGMSFEQLSGYLKKYYKEDPVYNENAQRTVKFISKNTKLATALYFSMENRKVNGVMIWNNSVGLSDKQADILLYETVQELFYSLENVKNINDNITKSSGQMEKSGLSVTVKTDNSKENPFIELSVGKFSGIE